MPNRRMKKRKSKERTGPVMEESSDEVSLFDKKNNVELPKLSDFEVDDNTFSTSQIRAAFYPKFENEKSDQEIRTRMIEMVSDGLATLEVSLKHSGSLFMYAGHVGGAYAKNSFGNIYTAAGVFVLGRMFREAWGTKSFKKQTEFNNFLEENQMCISMELVTAVLGDHGQRPRDDYIVVTAVTELANGKPKFYSSPDIIEFCREWRLPTNHVWLFSTRVHSYTSQDWTELVVGLLMLLNHHMGPSLREICAASRSDKERIRALLHNTGPAFCPDHSDWFGSGTGHAQSGIADESALSKFLQAHPTDYSTIKLQEIVHLMREKHFPAALRCSYNIRKISSMTSDNLHLKMIIHVHRDSTFKRYQKEMRHNRGLWPLYRGFFVDISLFKLDKERAVEVANNSNKQVKKVNGTDTTGIEGVADEDSNLMIKLKFLTYKLRTFLIRNGLSVLFKHGLAAYRSYHLRQMNIWNTSAVKQRELSKMLDEWAAYIKRKCKEKQLLKSTYLSEAEPFLEQYAKRRPENEALVGAAGDFVRAKDYLAIKHGSCDEENDLYMEQETTPSRLSLTTMDRVPKTEGLIVFFPGIPDCAKSSLCQEILNAPRGLGDDRPVHSFTGDLIKGKYWWKIAEECRRKPNSITLANKNAPNEEVWTQIEHMCLSTRTSAVPVIPDSEGTDSNPFSLEALAVFIFRVLQRANHPGNLDKASSNAGYVLLMFYQLYDGKSRDEFESELAERFGTVVKMPLIKADSRDEFESELAERFGTVVKMPLIKADRRSLPSPVKSILEEGLDLYKRHRKKHGRLDSSKGLYIREWADWEKRLREVLFESAEHLNAIQVAFEFSVKEVLEQLRPVAKGGSATPRTAKRKLGAIGFAAVTLSVTEINTFLESFGQKKRKVQAFLKDKDILNCLKKAHVTLAHKKRHGVTAVASYSSYVNQKISVDLTALLFSDKLAALEVSLGSIGDEKLVSRNPWPHVTIWTAKGVPPKEANTLPQLYSEGKATRIRIKPSFSLFGTLDLY